MRLAGRRVVRSGVSGLPVTGEVPERDLVLDGESLVSISDQVAGRDRFLGDGERAATIRDGQHHQTGERGRRTLAASARPGLPCVY